MAISAHAVLGTSTYSVTRHAAGQNVDGELVVPAPQLIEYRARVQSKSPGSETAQTYNTEHRLKIESQISIYGDTPLQTASSDGLTPGDLFGYRDRVYLIVRSDDNRDKVLAHCYAEGIEIMVQEQFVPPSPPEEGGEDE